MYKVYAIKSSKDGRIYVGFSKNIDRRLADHNAGRVISTKYYRPWCVIFLEDVGVDRKKAREREKYYKSGIGKEFLKTL